MNWCSSVTPSSVNILYDNKVTSSAANLSVQQLKQTSLLIKCQNYLSVTTAIILKFRIYFQCHNKEHFQDINCSFSDTINSKQINVY